jgi:ketosteroid isomerase-like protein
MTQPDVDDVLAANAELYAAIEEGDFDRMAAIWIDGPSAESAICVHPGWLPVRGRSAVLRSWAVIMANTSYVQFFLTDVHAEMAGDTAVVTCGENILTAVDDDLGGGHAVSTNVFRRTPDGWRLWIHHASPVLRDEDLEPEDLGYPDGPDDAGGPDDTAKA